MSGIVSIPLRSALLQQVKLTQLGCISRRLFSDTTGNQTTIGHLQNVLEDVGDTEEDWKAKAKMMASLQQTRGRAFKVMEVYVKDPEGAKAKSANDKEPLEEGKAKKVKNLVTRGVL
eukprot:comp12256_c0_seq1/m.7065 comp12256_c0_seq1/g.7065  ORF comp12256_c0_seq1/g.7065 comp12256_c0_seq1/m.7065 type:complete len:117 (-) comp12256_c0_seq1:408-758(-)